MVAHDCPHTRQCVLVWGFHTDEEYSSFGRISMLKAVSLTSYLHGRRVILIMLRTSEYVESFSVA